MATALAPRARGKVARKKAPLSARMEATSSLGASYEAGSSTRRTIGWRAPTTSANQAVLPTLTSLRDRSRAAVRNNGYAAGIITKLVVNLVGTGIQPLSKAADPDFARLVQELWLHWTDESDAAGLLDFYGQQAQAIRCWLEAGECFVRIRSRYPGDRGPDGRRVLSVPIQVEVIEPELCPHTYSGYARNGNAIKAGIEFDKLGRRVAYYFAAYRPEDPGEYNLGDLRRVPASSVCHIFNPIRPGQIRGVPHLSQALIKLNELDKYDDATLLRQQIGNLFAGFVQRPAGDQIDVSPLTGQTATSTADDGKPIVSLEPGIFQEMAPGEEVTFSDPPDPPATYPAFVKSQLMSIAAATGVPYEVLTGDMAGLNDRVMRVILLDFRRLATATQHQIAAHQFCRPIWGAWFDAAYLSGALPVPADYLADPRPWSSWDAVRWMPQGWPYIHPVQDVQAAQSAILAGFTSRSAVVSEQGEDAAAIDAEQAADNARADELGLSYDSDGRKEQATTTPPGGAGDGKEENETKDDPGASEGENPDDEGADPDGQGDGAEEA